MNTPTLDYSKRDYPLILNDLKTKIPTITNNWNDFLDSDLGYALVKTFAALLDHSNYYLDRQASETYLSSCEDRDSAVAISKMLGYTPKEVTSATVDVVISMISPYFEDIIIPAGTIITINSITFFTVTDAIINGGSTSVTIQCKEGLLYSNTFTSTGTPWQKFNVPKTLTEVVVYIDNVVWTRVPSFIFTHDVQTVYRYYADYSASVIAFSGGHNTTYPMTGQVIKITGIVSHGSLGNGESANLLATISSPITNSLLQNINNIFTAVTVDAPSGGSDPELLASIKDNAPKFYTTQNRAVTASDYEYLASLYPGVTSADAWGGESVGRYGEIFVCITSTSGVSLDSVKNYLESYKTLPMTLRVINPVPVYIDLQLNIYVLPFADIYSVRNNVETTIHSFFDNLRVGYIFQYSDLLMSLSPVNGLDYVDILFTSKIDGIVISKKAVVTLFNNYDITTTKIYQNSVLKWSYGDSEYAIVGNEFSVISDNLVDGTCRLEINSTSLNIYVLPEQRPEILTLTSSIYKTNNRP